MPGKLKLFWVLKKVQLYLRTPSPSGSWCEFERGETEENPHPCKNRKDAAHSVVWLWRELTSCAGRMLRFEGSATRLAMLMKSCAE